MCRVYFKNLKSWAFLPVLSWQLRLYCSRVLSPILFPLTSLSVWRVTLQKGGWWYEKIEVLVGLILEKIHFFCFSLLLLNSSWGWEFPPQSIPQRALESNSPFSCLEARSDAEGELSFLQAAIIFAKERK